MTKPLPLEFVTTQARLNWQDILFGFKKGLLDWKSIIELATRAIESDSALPEIIDLALASKENISEISKLLEAIAAKMPSQGSAAKKWFYLSLVWLYEHESQFSDPLSEVEDIASEFGFPEESYEMLRFMPPQAGYNAAMHSTEQNLARLRKIWRVFVEKHRTVYQSE